MRFEIDLEVYCSVCGEELMISEDGIKRLRGSYNKFIVEPCQKCQENKATELRLDDLAEPIPLSKEDDD